MKPTGYHNRMSLPNSHQQDGQKHINCICKKVLNAMYLKKEILILFASNNRTSSSVTVRCFDIWLSYTRSGQDPDTDW